MKTLQNHFVRSAVFLLFALLFPVLGRGQGTPYLNGYDFTVNITKGNSICNTPGSAIITYRNSVAGFKTLHYEFSNDNLTWEVMQDAAPDATITQTLNGWEDGDIVYIRVYGEMADGTKSQKTSLTSYSGQSFYYSSPSVAEVKSILQTEVAGVCGSKSGQISMSLNMPGFSSVEWKVYKGATLIKTLNSATPDAPITVDGLEAGNYHVVARATPACPTAHPTPSNPGVVWDGNILEITEDVEVGTSRFMSGTDFLATAMGTCGVSFGDQAVGFSKVSNYTIELLPQGGGAAIQTQNLTNWGANIVFFGLSDVVAGDYTMRLTTDCGDVLSKDFSIKSTEPQVYANLEVVNSLCANKHVILCSTNTLKPNVPQTYRIIQVSNNSIIATKTWKAENGVWQCRFENLPLLDNEDYVVEADFCGITAKSNKLKISRPQPYIDWTSIKAATGICSGDGGQVRITVKNSQNNTPLTLAGTLEVKKTDGTILFTQSMPDGWSGELLLNDIPPTINSQYYTARFTLNCNNLFAERTNCSVNLESQYYQIMASGDTRIEQCVPKYNVKFMPYGTTGTTFQRIIDGNFEVRKKDGTLVWQGNYVPDYDNSGYMKVPVPDEGTYIVTASTACGSLILYSNEIVLKKPAIFSGGFAQVRGHSFPCYNTGSVSINIITSLTPARNQLLWKLEKDDTPYRTGEFEVNSNMVFTDLPPGKYKFTAHIACDPMAKQEVLFEIKSELGQLKDFSSDGSCGSVVLGKTNFSFESFYPETRNYSGNSLEYSYRLYNTDTGVLYKEGVLNGYEKINFSEKLPSANYRIEVKPFSGICALTPYIYNFTVPSPRESVLVLSSGENSHILVTPTSYRGSTGSITAGVYINKTIASEYTISTENTPVQITLRSNNSSFTKTLTVEKIGKNVKFENLPAGLYTLVAQVGGSSCLLEQKVKVETQSDAVWSASAHLSPLCSNEQQSYHVSFRVAGTMPSLTTAVYTFKVFVWDDIASDYRLAGSLTGTPGQLTAVIDNIPDYTGTSAPPFDASSPNILAPYKYIIEEGGEEVYAALDVPNKAGYNYYHNQLQADMKLTQPTAQHPTGTATFTPLKTMTTYGLNASYPAALSIRAKIVWVCTRVNSENFQQAKKKDMFTPVTFDNLPPGNYHVSGNIVQKGCATRYVLSHNFEIKSPPTPPSPTDPLSDGLKLDVVGVNGVCDSDCKIKVKIENDPTLITKVTYTIIYTENETEKTKVISKSNSAEEVTFDGLPAGDYIVKAVAEVSTTEGLKLYQAEKTLKLQTASPDMNIIQHTEATRPSLKNCATGYLAFRFQDDDVYSWQGPGISRSFSDDYEFVITNAPTGVVTPLSFKVVHTSNGRCRDNTRVAISPFRNLPAGEYKVKIINHCKTLFLTCHIGEMEAPNLGSSFGECFDLSRYSDLYYSPCYRYDQGLQIYATNSKYVTPYTPIGNLYRNFVENSLYLWDDLFTYDIHDRFGSEMKNVPFILGNKELGVRPWAIDKVTLKFKCSAIPDQILTGGYSPCERNTDYCGKPTVDVTELINGLSLPETYTLVVNEMNGTVVGAEVLRKVNPNVAYSLGTERKKYLIQLYTADNILLYKHILTPVGIENSLSLHTGPSSEDVCKYAYVYASIDRPLLSCYAPYVIKVYTGDGSHTLIREDLINDRDSSHRGITYRKMQPNTDYELELYTADGTLLDRKTIHTASLYTDNILPDNLYFGNTCDRSYTNTIVKSLTLNNQQTKKMYYQLNYLYRTGHDNSKHYYTGPHILSVVKDGITYKRYVESTSFQSTYPIGISNNWFVERNGIEYKTEAPIFAWDEPINGTLTAPECGLSVNITGKAERRETIFSNTQLENIRLEQTCTGWNITPGGQVSYIDIDGIRRTLTYKEYRDPNNGVWKKVDVPFAKSKTPNRFSISLRSDELCDCNVQLELIYKPHTLNQIESTSYYCSGDSKGRIYVGAQDGVPPYRYELLKGENETDPIVETKTSSGPVVFEYGDVGKKYRVHVWDACGNLRIHYLTTVVSTVDLGYQLSKTLKLCASDNLKLTMQSFPGATYDWTLPDGTHRNTRIIDLGPATRAMAGAYNVVITPTDCNSTINATITVEVNDIGAPTWTPAVQTVCQGTTATLSPGAAQSYTDNTPGTPKYQWQKHDSNGTNFSDIAGATLADYAFQADYPGTYTFRRVTTYKGCEHTSDEAKVVVTPGPIQKLSPAELERTVRKGSTGYTLTVGSLQTNGTTIASYKWERSTDGVVWTTVGTSANYKETEKLKLEKVYYRRTVTPTVGTCAHTTPTITVNFKKMRTAYVNPHIRTRVKSE